MLELPTDAVHVHYVRADRVDDPARLAAYASWLAPDERERHARYVFRETRHEFLLTRALVRGVLSQYAPIAPAAWTFERNAYGAPAITNPGITLRFNVSNTAGLVALAITHDRELGIDVEHGERMKDPVELADRFFAPDEVRALHALPVAAQRARFFDYWTLKEAYIKARRMGLAIPLEHFAFQLDAPGPIRIAFAPELPDDPASWQFTLDRTMAPYTLATAVRSPVPLALTMFDTVPPI